MGSGKVRRKSLAFIKPVGLAIFADDVFSCGFGLTDNLSNVFYVFAQLLSGIPIGVDYGIEI